MPIVSPADVGAALRQRRQQLGLGQQALADRVGVSRQWIVEIEHGKPRAEIGLVLRTMEVLGLQLEIASGDRSSRRSAASDRGGERHEDTFNIDINGVIDRARRGWR